MIKGVLFDIDGTLVLSNDAHARSWQAAFAEFGYEVSLDDIRRLIGTGGDKLMPTLVPELTETEGVGKEIKERRQQLFLDEYAPHLQPAPGSRELVLALRERHIKSVAASSASSQELEVTLEAARVKDLLSEATSSDDAEKSKPDPDIVQAALDAIGLPADEVVMIGDTPYDIEAASRAGVACVAVRCGGWSDDKLQGAVAMYDDPADILKHLDDFLNLKEGK